MSISIESGIRKLDFKIEGSKKNLLHSSESLIKRTLRNLRSPPHQRPNWTTFSVHSTPPLTEISSIAISNPRQMTKWTIIRLKTKAKATCVQTAIPIIPRRSIKSLTIGLPRGERKRKELDTIDTWKSTPNYRDTFFPPRKHRRWNHDSREIGGIFQPARVAMLLCHRSVKLDSAKLRVDIVVPHEN